jgi:hypothetical protein
MLPFVLFFSKFPSPISLSQTWSCRVGEDFYIRKEVMYAMEMSLKAAGPQGRKKDKKARWERD